MAYRVPDDKAEEVLAELDFREKGGYTRAIIDVFRSSGNRILLGGGGGEHGISGIVHGDNSINNNSGFQNPTRAFF